MRELPQICLVVVDVRSAHNIGSFFRTCEGFGAELFIVGASPRPSHEGDVRLPHIAQKNQKDISKTALGASSMVRWRYVERLSDCIDMLRAEGYRRVYAIEQSEQSENINKLHIKEKTALVLGREVTGLTAEELRLCDRVYEIPMYGKKESFNVSVVAGIALYQARC